jgi:hypothetical protein
LTAARATGLSAAGSAALYLLFYYVPVSAGHTMEVYPWRPLGDWAIRSPVGLALFYAAILAGLFAIYGFSARRLRDKEAGWSGIRGAVFAGAAVAALVLLFLPSFLSKDLFDYMVHGRILALHRANPFQVPAEAFPPDDFLRAMGWPQFTALYGPGWISTCALLSWLAPDNVPGSVLLYKLVFFASHMVNGLLIGALLRGWGRKGLQGELLYLWNPLVILQVAGGAHNDGFLMTWVLLALLFYQRRDPLRGFYDEALAVVCMGLSILIKYVSAPLLGFLIAVRWREGKGLAGLGRVVILGALALAVFLLGYQPYVSGMDILHFLRPYEHGAYQGSALMLLDQAVKKLIPADSRGIYPEAVADIMLGASTTIAVLMALAGLVLLFRTRREEDVPRSGLYMLLAYLLVGTALLRVSYGVWIVALAALTLPGLARGTALVASGSLNALEIFWVYSILMAGAGVSIHREKALATLVAVGLPIAYLLAGFIRPLLTRMRRRGS